MKTYKRSLYVMIKGIIGAPFAGVIVFVVLSFFVEDMAILLGAGVVVALLILYMSVFSSRIHFTLSDSGEFCYYKKGRLKERYDLNKCGIGYRRKSDGEYINLEIVDETGRETVIDAEPLGTMRFMRMYEEMQRFVKDEEVLRAD